MEPDPSSLNPASDAPPASGTPTPASIPPKPPAPTSTVRRRLQWVAVAVVAILALWKGVPWAITAFSTVSTNDAYVSGHVTFVAPRVPGQVTRVLVDDNNHVRAGDLLVQLDKEPYQVQLDVAQAAVDAAQADLVTARAEALATAAKMRSLRFKLDHAIEHVDDQVEELRSKVASIESERAELTRAQSDYDRATRLNKVGGASTESVEHTRQALRNAQAQLDAAAQGIYQLRASLGLTPKPEDGDLAKVPPDLDQTFSTVREAQAELMQATSQIGMGIDSFKKTPKEMIADFYKRDAEGDVDRIYAQLLKDAPVVAQASSKLLQAQRNLDQAKLNLRYTDVRAEIDGVITRREVNPGNNVVAGQSLMALRSLTDVWVDANFKETQLADLRIGQPVDLYVDMYGGRQAFQGRISGFTMGTGSTLALLPAENATGNFVKVVQRLPVRIDLVGYDPDKVPLFIGLSVHPYVHVRAEPTGPNAGKVLQPLATNPIEPSPAGAATP
jgi:membrane fusion protein (multidrug efflux system)